ncbi:hypothetical protein RHMOL_Rhmol06G0087700 [Rhododendron molle]|uniref:Uncharacterized protein n=1 Tax=Rhododendron molle TaxID=49168 RepID=A0ACC0NBG5_RHOML|nr:hypothetical protein RHMOL_Rhmol06G0087700 [Rhododendron molle]
MHNAVIWALPSDFTTKVRVDCLFVCFFFLSVNCSVGVHKTLWRFIWNAGYGVYCCDQGLISTALSILFLCVMILICVHDAYFIREFV